jgi:hypothetical protein
LPTPGATPTTSNTMTPTTAFSFWTWWTPVDEADDLDETENKKDNLKSTAISVTEKAIETTTAKIDEEITTNINLKADAVNDKEPVTETNNTDDKITTEAIEAEAVTAKNTASTNEQADQRMKDKYLKLVEHNSQLVEILRATLEIQSDRFGGFSNTCFIDEICFELFTDIGMLKYFVCNVFFLSIFHASRS